MKDNMVVQWQHVATMVQCHAPWTLEATARAQHEWMNKNTFKSKSIKARHNYSKQAPMYSVHSASNLRENTLLWAKFWVKTSTNWARDAKASNMVQKVQKVQHAKIGMQIHKTRPFKNIKLRHELHHCEGGCVKVLTCYNLPFSGHIHTYHEPHCAKNPIHKYRNPKK